MALRAKRDALALSSVRVSVEVLVNQRWTIGSSAPETMNGSQDGPWFAAASNRGCFVNPRSVRRV